MKKNKNGLSLEIKYCKNCNLSIQWSTSTNEYFHTSKTAQQNIKFDKDGLKIYKNFLKLN